MIIAQGKGSVPPSPAGLCISLALSWVPGLNATLFLPTGLKKSRKAYTIGENNAMGDRRQIDQVSCI